MFTTHKTSYVFSHDRSFYLIVYIVHLVYRESKIYIIMSPGLLLVSTDNTTLILETTPVTSDNVYVDLYLVMSGDPFPIIFVLIIVMSAFLEPTTNDRYTL